MRLSTLEGISAFYDLHNEIQGDISKISDTPTARAIYGSYGALCLVMRLRELYRRKYNRGVVKPGKVTFAKFGSSLSREEDLFLESNLSALRKLIK